MKQFIPVTLSILQLVIAQVKMRDHILNGTLVNEESLLFKEAIDEILNDPLTTNSTEFDQIVPETTKLVTTSTLSSVITTKLKMITRKQLLVTEGPKEITIKYLLDFATKTPETPIKPTVTSIEPLITITTNLSETEIPTDTISLIRSIIVFDYFLRFKDQMKPLLPNHTRTLTDRLQSTVSPVTTEKQIVTTETEKMIPKFNPCIQEDPKMPNYSVPGLRISEINNLFNVGLKLFVSFSYSIEKKELFKLRPERQRTPHTAKEYDDDGFYKVDRCYSFSAWRTHEMKLKTYLECKEYLWPMEYKKILSQRKRDCEIYRFGFGTPAVGGGISTYLGEFPHMGAIGWKGTVNQWEFKCGSSLISPNFVLTAAHCTKVSSRDTTVTDPYPKIVRLGAVYIKTTIPSWAKPSDYRISKIILHPQYKAPKQYYDIALMKLDFDVRFTDILHPACLWTSFDISDLGVNASVTGWGLLQSAPIPIGPPPILQVGVVDFIDSELCDELLRPSCNRKQCGIKDHQICAGILAGGVDTCQGDSGGPLQVKIPFQEETLEKFYYVVGVTSFGIGCGLANSPSVYSRVSSFIDWIEEIVWPQSF